MVKREEEVVRGSRVAMRRLHTATLKVEIEEMHDVERGDIRVWREDLNRLHAAFLKVELQSCIYEWWKQKNRISRLGKRWAGSLPQLWRLRLQTQLHDECGGGSQGSREIEVEVATWYYNLEGWAIMEESHDELYRGIWEFEGSDEPTPYCSLEDWDCRVGWWMGGEIWGSREERKLAMIHIAALTIIEISELHQLQYMWQPWGWAFTVAWWN